MNHDDPGNFFVSLSLMISKKKEICHGSQETQRQKQSQDFFVTRHQSSKGSSERRDIRHCFLFSKEKKRKKERKVRQGMKDVNLRLNLDHVSVNFLKGTVCLDERKKKEEKRQQNTQEDKTYSFT